MIITDFGTQIMNEIDNMSRLMNARKLNLNPPGGFVGQLPQGKVTFDPVESTSEDIPSGVISLITNLNRIRGGWALGDGSIKQRHLESGIAIPTISSIKVEDEDESYTGINAIKFINAEIAHVSTNDVTVTIPTITNNYYTIPSGVGTRFQNFVWSFDGSLSSGIIGNNIYQFIDPFYVTKLVAVSTIPGSTQTVIGLQGSSDGIVWTNLSNGITIASGNYYTESIISGLVLNSGILLRSVVTTAGNLQGLNLILEGTVNMLTVGSSSGIEGLEPNRVVITDSIGVGTTSDSLEYVNGKITSTVVSDVNSSVISLNKTYEHSSPMVNGDVLASIQAGGFNEVEVVENKGSVSISASEDWSDTTNGTALSISLTPNSSTTPTSVLQLNGDGDLDITGDFFAKRALITELYVGAEDINTSLNGRTRNVTVINEMNDITPSTPSVTAAVFQDTEVKPSTIISAHARGTRHDPTPTLTDDVMFRATGRGYYGGINNEYAAQSRARIDFVSEDDYTVTDQGARMEFYITEKGTNTEDQLGMTLHDTGILETNGYKLNQTTTSGYVLTAIDTLGNMELRPPTGGSVIPETLTLYFGDIDAQELSRTYLATPYSNSVIIDTNENEIARYETANGDLAITSLPAGIWNVNIGANNDGVNDAIFYWELYKVVGGVPTSLDYSETTNVPVGTNEIISCPKVLLADELMDLADGLQVRLYARSVSGLAEVTFNTGGTTYAGLVSPTISTGGIPEAPIDGQQYARQDASWTVVTSSTGGIEEAPIDGQKYARKDGGWESFIIPSGGESTDISGLVPYTGATNNVDLASHTLVAASVNGLTSIQVTDLTDSGNTTLHYHSADRDSANFTGTDWTDLTDGGVTTLHSHTSSSVTNQALFTLEGILFTNPGKIRIYNQLGRTATISKVFIAVDTQPTVSSIIVDINKNGTTIFTNQAHRPSITALSNTGSTSTIDVATWNDGEYLTMDIDQIGSPTAGSDLSVHVVYT